MNKLEFIEWIESSTSFVKSIVYDYEDLMNYAEYTFNYLSIKEDKVEFIHTWRDDEGYIDTEEDTYTFEEFIERYENYTL